MDGNRPCFFGRFHVHALSHLKGCASQIWQFHFLHLAGCLPTSKTLKERNSLHKHPGGLETGPIFSDQVTDGVRISKLCRWWPWGLLLNLCSSPRNVIIPSTKRTSKTLVLSKNGMEPGRIVVGFLKLKHIQSCAAILTCVCMSIYIDIEGRHLGYPHGHPFRKQKTIWTFFEEKGPKPLKNDIKCMFWTSYYVFFANPRWKFPTLRVRAEDTACVQNTALASESCLYASDT